MIPKVNLQFQPLSVTSAQHNHFMHTLEELSIPISYKEVENDAWEIPHLVFSEVKGSGGLNPAYSICLLRDQSQPGLEIRPFAALQRNGYSAEKIAEFSIERADMQCAVFIIDGRANYCNNYAMDIPAFKSLYAERRTA